jgi:hypothetical protein
MNAIPGRYNKRDSTQVSRRAQTPTPLSSVRRRPLPFYKEPLEEPLSERLAVRLRVTPARVLLLGQQWGEWLAGSAVGTKKCDRLTLELMRRRRLIQGDRHICARCRPVCRGAAIPLIDAHTGSLRSIFVCGYTGAVDRTEICTIRGGA